MGRRGKKYREAIKQVDSTRLYPLMEAIELAKQTAFSKFVEGIDIAVNLGVDPRHADQNVRGAVALPHGLGRSVRIVVFAKGEKAIEAKDFDVEFVGGDDLAEKIQEGWLDFDQVVATPDMMAVVGKLGRVLGPRGLMPNPKMGTVTFNIKQAVDELKAGRAEFRVDKNGIVHSAIGKVNMESAQLSENASAVIDALQKAKPSSSRGSYLRRMTVSATMGPGVKVDLAPFKG